MRHNQYVYKATVTRVIDGDTVECSVDLGFNIRHTVRLRLMYYDAPEIFRGPLEEREEGKRWTAALEDIVLFRTVTICTNKDRTTFNRYEAEIWLDGQDVREELLKRMIGVAQ